MRDTLKSVICFLMLLGVILMGCGSDEQMLVEEETEEIQIIEMPVVEVVPEPIPIDVPAGMVYVPTGEFIMGSDQDVDPMPDAVSYTHLTLPTICSV